MLLTHVAISLVTSLSQWGEPRRVYHDSEISLLGFAERRSPVYVAMLLTHVAMLLTHVAMLLTHVAMQPLGQVVRAAEYKFGFKKEKKKKKTCGFAHYSHRI